jgi:hypothetical protein
MRWLQVVSPGGLVVDQTVWSKRPGPPSELGGGDADASTADSAGDDSSGNKGRGSLAQSRRDLTPEREARSFFGAELRYWRVAGFSQDRLGAEVHVSGDMVAKIEKAVRWPLGEFAATCDDVLETGAPSAGCGRSSTSSATESNGRNSVYRERRPGNRPPSSSGTPGGSEPSPSPHEAGPWSLVTRTPRSECGMSTHAPWSVTWMPLGCRCGPWPSIPPAPWSRPGARTAPCGCTTSRGGELLDVAEADLDWVRVVAFANDRPLLASAFSVGPIRVWDVSDRSLRPMTQREAPGRVRHAAFTATDDTIVTGTEDATVRLAPLSPTTPSS